MSKFKVGDPAVYNSTFGKILGKIAGFGSDSMGDYTEFRVTSRRKPGFIHWSILKFYTEINLHVREVRK